LLTAGDTFTVEQEGNHLVIVVKVCPHGNALHARVTTAAMWKPILCPVHPADHPGIQHESGVHAEGVRDVAAAQLEALRESQSAVKRQPASPELLKRIIEAVPASPDCSPRVKRFVQESCCP
jgi:hypothetical protein